MNYLYNGAELPALPEWDKKTYPYVVMIYKPESYNEYSYFAYFYNQRPEWRSSYGSWAVRAEGDYLTTYHTGVATESWTDLGSYTNPSAVTGRYVYWTNFDILNADDGSVYFAASYPIDAETGEEITIYEPNPVPVPQLNPAALMQGFLEMQGVRRSRT